MLLKRVREVDVACLEAGRVRIDHVCSQQLMPMGAQFQGGVKVDRIVNDPTPVKKVWEPGNPLADKEGFVYHSNVNEMSEMVDMMAASRAYQNNVEVVNTARQLMSRTLDIIKS